MESENEYVKCQYCDSLADPHDVLCPDHLVAVQERENDQYEEYLRTIYVL